MKHFSLPEDGGLIEAGLPKDILHGFDKIYADISEDSFHASSAVAEEVINAVNAFDAKAEGRLFKLGLTTGVTPVQLYKLLCDAHNEGRVSFRDVEVFTVDEYYPSRSDEMQSRNCRIHSSLIDKIDILPENVHIPDGSIPQEQLPEYCAAFDKAAREMDLLVIGIGEYGQVGFNEAGSSPRSRTRVVTLPYASRKRQAHNFNGDLSTTPSSAITMGVGTMMTSRRIILMAWGEEKAQAVKDIVEGRISSQCPASFFQNHSDASLYVDETAASLLTRIVSPWKIGRCEWTRKFRRKAVVWLCEQVDKPILKLTQNDYLQNSLGELLDECGPFDKINIEVFNDLQHTITGWPGGKPEADDSTRPVASAPFPKKVLIFSPHPDDDVISMGGTFIRLVHQGHDVHVAYETSGNVAVHDDVVLQHIDAAAELGYGDRYKEINSIIKKKVPGEPEPRELLALKAAIRRSEAKAAVRSFGLDSKHNTHFLNLPFYESGGVTKFPRTQADVDIIKALIKELRPNQIYMAGDLADPHGTHRVCTEAVLEALDQLRAEGETWLDQSYIWLYRGAWMEWEIGRVDMAVPLSPDEVVEKRHAIYRHLSQKDIVPFPGDDPREFWQRAEERNASTARQYDALGMAEYQAMEVFLRLK